MTTTLTTLETALLANLKGSGFDGPTYWSNCGAVGGLITRKNVAGVVSSLAKKGVVTCSGSGDDMTITVL